MFAFVDSRGTVKMTYCKECGHKLGFFEHATDGICNGCRQRIVQKQVEEAHAEALAPYIGAELPFIAVSGVIMKKGEIAHFVASTMLKEIKTVRPRL
jgi:hypothetical protein